MAGQINVLGALGKWVLVPVMGGALAYYVATSLLGPATPAETAPSRDVAIVDPATGATPDPTGTPAESPSSSTDPAVTDATTTPEPDAIPAGVIGPDVEVTVKPDKVVDPPKRRHHRTSDKPKTPKGAAKPTEETADMDAPKVAPSTRRGSKNPPTDDGETGDKGGDHGDDNGGESTTTGSTGGAG